MHWFQIFLWKIMKKMFMKNYENVYEINEKKIKIQI